MPKATALDRLVLGAMWVSLVVVVTIRTIKASLHWDVTEFLISGILACFCFTLYFPIKYLRLQLKQQGASRVDFATAVLVLFAFVWTMAFLGASVGPGADAWLCVACLPSPTFVMLTAAFRMRRVTRCCCNCLLPAGICLWAIGTVALVAALGMQFIPDWFAIFVAAWIHVPPFVVNKMLLEQHAVGVTQLIGDEEQELDAPFLQSVRAVSLPLIQSGLLKAPGGVQNWELDAERFRGMEHKGHFGYIYEGWYDGQKVAVKLLQRQSVKDFLEELLANDQLARLTHPNLAKFVGAARDPPRLVSVWQEGSPVRALIVDSQHELRTQPTRLRFLLQGLLSALEYMHSLRVVHRDINTDNVLFDPVRGACLLDFGLARRLDRDYVYQNLSQAHRPFPLWPPEALRPQGAYYSAKSDVFMVAMLVRSILLGNEDDPFPALPDDPEHLTVLPAGPLRDALTRSFLDDPVRRPTAAELGALCR